MRGIKRIFLIFFLTGLCAFLIPFQAYAYKDIIARVRGPSHFDGKYFSNIRLAGIRIIPGLEDYVKGMLKWRLVGKQVSFSYDPKIADSSGWQLVYMYCKNSGFTFAGVSRYYDKIVINKTTLFLNAYLISQGLAVPDGNMGNKKYKELFEKLYQEAKRRRIGAWYYMTKDGHLRIKRKKTK